MNIVFSRLHDIPRLIVCMLALGISLPATAAVDLVRLVWTDDPTSTLTIGWRQGSGDPVQVRYRDRNDPFAPWSVNTNFRTGSLVNLATGPDTGGPAGVVPTQDPFTSTFTDLTGLAPDTDYEFEICDSEGCTHDYMYFRTAPATPKPFTLIAGGDSRRSSSAFGPNDEARRRGFRLVGKIRPLAVIFSGDFMDEGVYGEWLIWMNEWQLTRSSDGRMYPLVPTHGNHENQDREMIAKVFGTNNQGPANAWGTFGKLTIGGNMLRLFTLNSSLDPSTSVAFGGSIGYNDLRATDSAVTDAWAAQNTWLAEELAQADAENIVWKLANYHHPIRPHDSGKDDGIGRYAEWAPLFDAHNVDLAIESDTHNLKVTVPLVPTTNTADASPTATAEEDFIEADWAAGRHGTVFIGEGSWGAPKRAVNDDKVWTLASDSVWQFKLLHVAPEALTVHTVIFEEDSYPNGVNRDVLELPQASQDADPLAMPDGLDLWQPFQGDIPLTLLKPASAGQPTFRAVTPKPVVPDTGTNNALFFEDFSDGTLGKMEAVDLGCNAQADDNWFNASTASFAAAAARINTFPSTGACDDWLITPAIDLSTLDGVTLSFDSAYFFSGPALQVLASSDYVPGTNPTSATWVPAGGGFTWNLPPTAGSTAFAPSGPIGVPADLFPTTERNGVHFAIRHLKPSGGQREWSVDNIKVEAGLVPQLASINTWRPLSVTGQRTWGIQDFGDVTTMVANAFTLDANATTMRAYLVSPPATLPADATDADFQFRYRLLGETDAGGVGQAEALILDNCTLTGNESAATVDAQPWQVLQSTTGGLNADPGLWTQAPPSSMLPYQGREVCFAFRYVGDPIVARQFGVANAALGETVPELDVPVKSADTVRFAMFNTLLANRGPGVLAQALSTPGYTQAQGIAEIIQRVNPDVILLNEFDYDEFATPAGEGTDDPNAGLALERFVRNYLAVSQNGQAAITDYAYLYSFPSNTGLQPESVGEPDCNFSDPKVGCSLADVNDPAYDDGNDAFGFGKYEGAFAMAVISRYPIDLPNVKTFQKFRWEDMPGALIPNRPIGTLPAWYDATESSIYRLSSKNHIDVPVVVNINGRDEVIHVLGSHPTPPVFDDALEQAAGPQYVGTDPHGRRNHDENRFWADYVSRSGDQCYIYEDRTANTTRSPACLGPGRRFVIMGDMNADPQFGDSFATAILNILSNPAVDDSFTPISSGATVAPFYATLDNGQWRLDYAVASEAGLDYRMDACDAEIPGYPGLACGVFYPSSINPLARLMEGSCATPDPETSPGAPNCASADHRLVWIDVAVGADTDGDEVVDEVDNCPAVANTTQTNFDADSAGDACDDDADGDGLTAAWERDNSTDEFAFSDLNPLDALSDVDGDGLTALEEFARGSDPNAADVYQVPLPLPATAGLGLLLAGLGLRTRNRSLPPTEGQAMQTKTRQSARHHGAKVPVAMTLVITLGIAMGISPAQPAQAVELVATAFDAATVRPDGPRAAADNGKTFMNVEGRNNGIYANYGVLRFRLDTATGAAVADLSGATINRVTLRLTQSNAGFTQTGNVAVYFSNDDDAGTGADALIDDLATAGLNYDASFTFDVANPLAVDAGNTPFGADFPDAVIVGGEVFEEISTGTVNNLALTRNLQAFAHVDNGTELTVTLILADFNDDDVAATWFGSAGTTPPQLIIDYTP